MPFLGVQPTDTFASVAKQTLTADVTGTTVFTLSHGVSSSNDIALYINNIRQEPVTSYTASGTTLTLTDPVFPSDDVYLIYIARTFQSVGMKGITDDTEDPILTISGSNTTGGNAILNVGQNQTMGYYVESANYGFEIYNGGVGGNTVQIISNGQAVFRHHFISDAVIFSTGNTDRVKIDSSGNMGIGDTAPSALLSIRNGSAEGTVAEFYGSTDGKTRPLSITSGTVNNFSGAEWTFGIGSSGGEFVFENNTHATPSELARITSGGQLNAYGFKSTGANNAYPIKIDSETFVYYPHYNTAHVAYYKRAVHPSNSNEYQYYWRTSDTGTAGGANETTWMTLNTGSTHGGKLHLTGGVSFASNFASANTLDDYEEGSFTATLRGGTEPATLISDASNYYTKIGNVVKARISIENVDTTGYAGDVSFTGLPFTSANNTRTIGTLISYRGMTTSATATTGVVSMIFPNSSTISTREGDSGSAWLVPQHSAGTGKYFFVDIVYMTAS